MTQSPAERSTSLFSFWSCVKFATKSILYLVDFAAKLAFGILLGGVFYTDFMHSDSLDVVGYCFCGAGVLITGIPLFVACANQSMLNKRKDNSKYESLKIFNYLLLGFYPFAQFYFLLMSIALNARCDETGAVDYGSQDFITLMIVGNGALFLAVLFFLILTIVYRNHKL